MEKPVNIYTLRDPITNEIRYIGKTSQSLDKRLCSHCTDFNLNRNVSYKNSWIKRLKTQNKRPIIELLDIVNEEDWQFWEKYWISQFKTWGFNLTNMTLGGDGCNGGSGCRGYKHTLEAKKKIGIANSRPKSKEWIKNAAEATRLSTSVQIIQYDLNNNFIKEWKSFCYAAKFVNKNNYVAAIKNIHLCCNNKRKTAYGYIWKYKNK